MGAPWWRHVAHSRGNAPWLLGWFFPSTSWRRQPFPISDVSATTSVPIDLLVGDAVRRKRAGFGLTEGDSRLRRRWFVVSGDTLPSLRRLPSLGAGLALWRGGGASARALHNGLVRLRYHRNRRIERLWASTGSPSHR